MITLRSHEHRPDTCGCVYEVEESWPGQEFWDWSVLDVTRICPAHAHLGTPEDIRDAIKEEQQRKSFSVSEVLSKLDDREFTQHPEAQVAAARKRGEMAIGWRFDAVRNLHLTLPHAPNSPLARDFQRGCDERFGAGRVRVS